MSAKICLNGLVRWSQFCGGGSFNYFICSNTSTLCTAKNRKNNKTKGYLPRSIYSFHVLFQDDKIKQSFKMKLEMAKFLQQTLDEMAVTGKGHSSKAAKDFVEFFEKVMYCYVWLSFI